MLLILQILSSKWYTRIILTSPWCWTGGDSGLPVSGSPFVDIDNPTLGYNRILEGNPGVWLGSFIKRCFNFLCSIAYAHGQYHLNSLHLHMSIDSDWLIAIKNLRHQINLILISNKHTCIKISQIIFMYQLVWLFLFYFFSIKCSLMKPNWIIFHWTVTCCWQEYSRFGYALAAMDINLDGNMDIAVSASSLSNKGLLDYNVRALKLLDPCIK